MESEHTCVQCLSSYGTDVHRVDAKGGHVLRQLLHCALDPPSRPLLPSSRHLILSSGACTSMDLCSQYLSKVLSCAHHPPAGVVLHLHVWRPATPSEQDLNIIISP